MSTTANRALGIMAALVLAAAVASAARADWLAYSGGPERTGFTTQAVLPPLSVAWKYATDAGDTYGVTPIVVGEMIYWVTGNDLTAIQADTAMPVWVFHAPDRIRSSPAYADGTLYFGADNGVFYALEAETGALKWHFQSSRSIRSAPAVVDGVVYVGTNDAKVFALDAATGDMKWEFRSGDDVYAAITVTGSTVWVTSTDNTLHGVDLRNGHEKWSIPFIGAGGLRYAPAAQDRRAYLAVKDRVYRISASGMSRPLGGALSARISAPLALGRNHLYAGCRDGMLYALSPTGGRVEWSYQLHGAVLAQPLVAGNLVVAGGSQGEVVALDADTGALRWIYGERAPWEPERGVNYQLMAAAASGGALYLSWDDGRMARLTADADDISPPEITRLTPEAGSPAGPVSPTASVVVGANVYDVGSGVNPAAVTMTLDGNALQLTRSTSGDYYHSLSSSKSAPALENGWHTVVVTAQDQRGNQTTKTWTFLCHLETTEEGETVQPGDVGTTETF